MARQTPTLEDINLPGVQGPRPVAGYDVSAWGQGAQALAKSGQVLGADIQKSAQDIAEVQTYRARNQALLAQDNALGDAIQLRDKYRPGGEKYNPDPTALTQSYQTDLDTIMDKHLSTIPEGPLRDHARARMQIPFAHEIASVGAEARKTQISDWRAKITDEADGLVNTTGAQDDPLHTAKMQQWGQKLQLGLQQGYLSPVEAEKLQRNTARGVIDGEFRARFRTGRDGAQRAVADLEMAQAGVVSPAIDAWRSAGMSDKGIAGVLHNIREESGFNPALRHFDQPRYAQKHPEDPEGAFAHGLYQEGADEWNRYESWLAGKGEGADWRDPRLQSQFAAWNLKTNYPATWQKMQSAGTAEQAAGIYASEYLKPAAQYLRSRIDKISQDGVRPLDAYRDGEPQTGNPAYDILTPTHRDTLIKEGHSILRAYDVDDGRAQKEQEKQQKELWEQNEAAIFHDLHGPKPSTTAEGLYDLYTGRSLSKEGYERMVNLLETRTKVADKEDHDGKTYGTAFHDLLQRIHPQDGHLAPLSDPSQITDFYIQNPDQLTFAGHEKLVGMINANRKSLDDHAANTARTGLLNYAKSKLSFEQDTGPVKIRDPKGEAIFNAQFIPKFEAGYDAHIKAGKDPWQYLSKDNVDGLLKGMRSPAEMNAEYMTATGQAVEPPEAPNAPLPAAPEGADEGQWKAVVKTTPQLDSGQPMSHALWGRILATLNENPSPKVMAAFDKHFGEAGFTAKDVLGKINPAALKAAQLSGDAADVPPAPGTLPWPAGAAATDAAPPAPADQPAAAPPAAAELHPEVADPREQRRAQRAAEQAQVTQTQQRDQEAWEADRKAGAAATDEARQKYEDHLTDAKRKRGERQAAEPQRRADEARKALIELLDEREKHLLGAPGDVITPAIKRELERVKAEREKLSPQGPPLNHGTHAEWRDGR